MLIAPRFSVAQSAGSLEFFEARIRPVLANNCYACHTNSQLGGLRVDSLKSLLTGGKSGPAIVPGKPEESLLVRAVRHDNPNLKMPLGSKLKDQEITDLFNWVKMGAPWPESETPRQSTNREYVPTPEQRSFWSFQPIHKQALPKVKDESWVKSPIDRFILGNLEARGLSPVKRADKRTLIRRASFDLVGLPPTPEEVEAFLKDSSSDAFAKVVDRLLASPHYGERWGRHWLDVARYAEDDVRGGSQEGRELYSNAWRYRDWVIQAFNQDMPYDVFVKGQIAGDLLDLSNGSKIEPNAPRLTGGTGFLGLGVWIYDNAPPPEGRANERDERVDALSRAFLGLTVACARCHDHKYDPISTKDYYALAGVFAGTEYAEYPLVPATVVTEFKRREKGIKDQQTALDEFVQAQATQLGEILARKTSQYMLAAWKVLGDPKRELQGVADEEKLDTETLQRWVEYLGKPHHVHPYLNDWHQLVARGGGLEEARKLADTFQEVVLAVIAEKKEVDEENRAVFAQARRRQTPADVLLPNRFVTYEDYCPGCSDPIRPIERNKVLLWRDLFLEQEGSGKDSSKKVSGVLLYKDDKLDRFLGAEWKDHLAWMRAELERLKKELRPRYPYLHGARDTGNPQNIKLHLRGNPRNLGEEVPRRFVAVLSPAVPAAFSQGSGRLELAEAVANHPLIARVMVNRLWFYHFGQGIVGTPSNFGQLGDRPTHPELLEYLAGRFVAGGYSVKALHREVMLSATYQLSGEFSERNFSEDPDNRLFWRANHRRLDAEPLRDALLFVTGSLDRTLGGPSAELTDSNRRRTVYASVSRFKPNARLATFDFPDARSTSEKRNITHVPLQRLFFLNSGLIWQQAEQLANRLAAESADDTARIKKAYRFLYAREATDSEIQLGLDFLQQVGKKAWQQYAQVLLSANEFLFVD
jgi:hypothetical protein